MILGREQEQSTLHKLLTSKKAEFLALYGRRRVGKTYLIREFFKNKGVYLEVTGSHKAPNAMQLRHFFREYNTLFPGSKAPKDWVEAFELILKAAKTLAPAVKFIFFIDELPWLASRKSGLVPALDYFWNRHFSSLPNFLLIICGSAAHWMIRKIIHNRGGLYGRLSEQIRLQPFTLHETEQFLHAQEVHLQRSQIVELYMALGGIAQYLAKVQPGLSSSQIINHLCFSPAGSLFSEFLKLYESLFDTSERHLAIVHALAKHRYGMQQEELLHAIGSSYSGRTTAILQELEECGFIMHMPALGKNLKERKWRLVDEYSLFYLKWIAPITSNILRNFDTDYWHKQHRTSAWHGWAGYSFETICLKHSKKIKEALGLGGVMTEESHWQYRPKKTSSEKGTEIDLVIDRADQCINLCEIKYCDKEFEITKSYAETLQHKKETFKAVTKTKKTLFLTLITPYGAIKNVHYLGLVDQQLTLDALF